MKLGSVKTRSGNGYDIDLITLVIKCDENLKELKKIPTESVDLIYIDPSFFTQRNWGDFDDRWKSRDEFISFLRPRLVEMKRVLKSTGSLYMHSDWHSSHHVRLLLDDVFGEKNFKNEIIWHYRRWTGKGKSFFSRMHDAIFFYAKSSDTVFNTLYEPLSPKTLKRFGGMKVKDVITPKGTHTKITRNIPSKGVAMHDVWDLSLMNSQSKENLGYPTQKLEALVERVIRASSNSGDLVLDAFGGSGTICAVAQKLGRRSICIDNNPRSCEIMNQRLS